MYQSEIFYINGIGCSEKIITDPTGDLSQAAKCLAQYIDMITADNGQVITVTVQLAVIAKMHALRPDLIWQNQDATN